MKNLIHSGQRGFYAYQDPDAQANWSVASWIEGATFVSVQWLIEPDDSPGPELYDDDINSEAVRIGGRNFGIGELASVFVRNLDEGETYVVTCRGTFSDGQVDDRSFRLICRQT